MQPLPAQRTLKGRRPAVASLASLIPLILFLLVALAASIVVRRRADAAGGGFVNSYFIGNRAPVSYTHLDVYKRQITWRITTIPS